MYTIAICCEKEEILEKLEKEIKKNLECKEKAKIITYMDNEILFSAIINRFDLVIFEIKMCEKNKNLSNDSVFAALTFLPKDFTGRPYQYFVTKFEIDKMRSQLPQLLCDMKQNENHDYVQVTSDGVAVKVNIRDILYVTNHNRGSKVVVGGLSNRESWKHFDWEKHKRWAKKWDNGVVHIYSNEKLEEWYKQLGDKGFEYSHCSYIVNMFAIDIVQSDDVILENGETISISKTRRAQFHRRLTEVYGKKYHRELKKERYETN